MGPSLLRIKGFQWVLVFVLFSVSSVSAQAPVSITTNAGDQSAGSLGAAITTLNGAGAGTLDFQLVSPDSITLTQPLPSITQGVTFQGQDTTIVAENNAQAQFLFQQNFSQKNNLFFQNTGVLGAGLDASITAPNWTMDPAVRFNLNASAATNISTTGGVGVTGENGGNSSVTVGTWTVGFGAGISGGAGGSVTDNGGAGDVGGDGGSASVTSGSLNFSGIYLQLSGGAGGSVTDLGNGTNTGGNGGSALFSSGFISVGAYSDFTLQGGVGGRGVTSGDGGSATVNSGSITMQKSNLSIQGGVGGAGVSASGAGGSAFVSFGTFTGFTGSNLTVTGARGGVGVLTAGDGGDAFAKGGSVSLSGLNTTFQVYGGNGGNLGPVASGTGNGGNGGSAGVSLGILSIGTGTNFTVAGGTGGYGTSGASPGLGGQGGDTSLTLGTFSAGVSTNFYFNSGTGGVGGMANAGGTGAAGGDGGALAVSMGNLDLGAGANIHLVGGTGGAGGNVVSGGTGGVGGDGGNVSFDASSVTMGTGSVLSVQGGNAGYGGTGGTNGLSGAQGGASATIGSLNGAGYLSVSGSNVSLNVAGGSFAGNIAGSVELVKTGSGYLILSGSNSYSGGTSISAGTLQVNTGGSLGTGAVVNNSDLIYVNSATAGNSTLVNNFSLLFSQFSSAGNAVVTNNDNITFLGNSTSSASTITNNYLVLFQDNSSGGSGSIITGNGGNLVFTQNSTGGLLELNTNGSGNTDFSDDWLSSISIGSIAGSGTYYLGSIGLITGANNISTTVSGLIADGGINGGIGGSLTKLGTGILTLTGANTYSGGTGLISGTLKVGNNQALGTGSMVVNGGTLSTAGTTLAFQIGGNYTQASAGKLQIGLGGAGASTSDLMNVTGTTSLNGTLSLADYGSLTAPTIGQSVTVITGASVTGRFSMVEQALTGMRFLPLYQSGSVALESVIPTFLQTALTANQTAVATDLDKIFGDGREYDLMLGLVSQSSSSLPASFDQISPEGFTAFFHAGIQTALNQASFVGQRLEQVRNETANRVLFSRNYREDGSSWFAANLPPAQEVVMTAPKTRDGWGTFINGSGGLLNVTGDTNAAGFKITSYGLTGAGMDKKISKDVAVGLLAGYGHSGITLDGGGTLTADGGQLGLYGAWSSGVFYADAFLEGGLNNYGTQRVGFGGTATGTSRGMQFSESVLLGTQWKQGPTAIGPWISTQITQLSIDGFVEKGSLAPLTIPSLNESSVLTRVGINGAGRWKTGGLVINPSFKAAFEHEFNFAGGSIPAGLGIGDSFAAAGPVIGQNGFLVGVGINVGFSKDLNLSLDYQGELGRTNWDSQQLATGLSLSI